MTEVDYYWEKAEFQDEFSHKKNLESYMAGVRVSVCFDDQYTKEAIAELRKNIPERYDVFQDPNTKDWFAYDNKTDSTLFWEDTELDCFVGLTTWLAKGEKL